MASPKRPFIKTVVDVNRTTLLAVVFGWNEMHVLHGAGVSEDSKPYLQRWVATLPSGTEIERGEVVLDCTAENGSESVQAFLEALRNLTTERGTPMTEFRDVEDKNKP